MHPSFRAGSGAERGSEASVPDSAVIVLLVTVAAASKERVYTSLLLPSNYCRSRGQNSWAGFTEHRPRERFRAGRPICPEKWMPRTVSGDTGHDWAAWASGSELVSGPTTRPP